MTDRRVAEARALEQGARLGALEAKRRVLDWPRRRRVLPVRVGSIVLCLAALALWVWPVAALLVLGAAAVWPTRRARRRSWLWAELSAGSRADLRRSRAVQLRAIEAHDRALTLLVDHDPGFDEVRRSP